MRAISVPAPSETAIRQLLHRRVHESNRHRTALGRHLGLRTNELSAISLLAEHGALTPSDLGALLMLTSGGVTTLVQRLERLGHVHRRPHPQDGRSWVLSASPEIVTAIADLNAPLVAALDDVMSGLPMADRQAIIRFLTAVNTATERAADELLVEGADPTEAEDPRLDAALTAGLWT
jgi:DNA-binding MarR family transcriptional regulator